MVKSAAETEASRMLLGHLRGGSTGVVSIGDEDELLAVILLEGHMIAAEGPEDTKLLVRRFVAEGVLSSDEHSVLVAGNDTSPGFDAWLDRLHEVVAKDMMDRVFRERFEDNVSRFLGNNAEPSFVAESAMWPKRVHMGHDSQRLLRLCAMRWDAGAGVKLDDIVVMGATSPRQDLHRMVHAQVPEDGVAARDLLESLPMEFCVARAVVADAIREDVVQILANEEGDARQSTALDSGDLEAFSGGEDAGRGGGADGTFLTDIEHLDRVDIAMETSPAYAAGVLSHDDALETMRVANEVLAVIAMAFESVHGSGEGNALVTSLIGRCPASYAALFDGELVARDGTLVPDGLVRNLELRPPAERRRLLSQGLLDLLERALNRTADELPDEQVDGVLEQVLGYRQRMGL